MEFDWNDHKYPSNHKIAEVIKLMIQNLNFIDGNFRQKLEKFSKIRSELQQMEKS